MTTFTLTELEALTTLVVAALMYEDRAETHAQLRAIKDKLDRLRKETPVA